MHINDGLLPAQVWLPGYLVTGGLTWFSLRQIHRQGDPTQGIPKASLLTAAFFVASSIHIPIPPASVHLVLNGLLGVILGYYAFPAILIGLFLQAETFGHGGLSTLGVNAAMMGIPALLAHGIFQLYPLTQRWLSERQALGLTAFLAGSIGLGLAALIFWGLILTTIPADLEAQAEKIATYSLTLAHIPLMLIEGAFTTLLVLFLHKVKPELLKNQG
ncbi:MAG: cobalt transporter CbiM [Cyanobacteriota bacterium]|nr:cobalt transporter CbiM [Cyanobacteriota bacterium]